jgi:hypothetical protein
MSIRKIFALTLFAAVAISSAALAQGGGGGGGAGGGDRRWREQRSGGGCQWRWRSSRHNRRSNDRRPQCGYNDW